jgi:hypothetical protein
MASLLLVGDIEISFVKYSASKKVCLQLDIIEDDPGGQPPMTSKIRPFK